MRDLFDPFDHQPGAGGGLGMTVDQGGAVVVHAVDVEPQGPGHGDVVGGEGVVGLDGFQVADLDAGFVEGHLGRGGDGGGHVGLFGAGVAEGEQLDFDALVGAQLSGLARGW